MYTDWNSQVPMVAPFFGCTFGGWLYDAFIYTGDDSVVNTPYMGLGWLVKPLWQKRGAPQTRSPA